jgi:hypothetical protein
VNGWTLVGGIAAGIAIVLMLAHTTKLPHFDVSDDAPDDEWRAGVSKYLAQSQVAWRMSTIRTKVIVFAMVVVFTLFTGYYQAERIRDSNEAEARNRASCEASAENRQQQRNRDQRVIDDYDAEIERLEEAHRVELARIDARIADAVQPEDVPGVEPELLPVLVFLAESRDATAEADRAATVTRYEADLAALETRLEDARTEAEEYEATFPIPACNDGELTVDPTAITRPTTT